MLGCGQGTGRYASPQLLNEQEARPTRPRQIRERNAGLSRVVSEGKDRLRWRGADPPLALRRAPPKGASLSSDLSAILETAYCLVRYRMLRFRAGGWA